MENYNVRIKEIFNNGDNVSQFNEKSFLANLKKVYPTSTKITINPEYNVGFDIKLNDLYDEQLLIIGKMYQSKCTVKPKISIIISNINSAYDMKINILFLDETGIGTNILHLKKMV